MNIKIHIVAEPAPLPLAATLVDLDGGFRGRHDGRQALRRALRRSGFPQPREKHSLLWQL